MSTSYTNTHCRLNELKDVLVQITKVEPVLNNHNLWWSRLITIREVFTTGSSQQLNVKTTSHNISYLSRWPQFLQMVVVYDSETCSEPAVKLAVKHDKFQLELRVHSINLLLWSIYWSLCIQNNEYNNETYVTTDLPNAIIYQCMNKIRKQMAPLFPEQTFHSSFQILLSNSCVIDL